MIQAARLSVRRLMSAYAGPFDFDVTAGSCVVIQGPSGSGKSSLLRMIADLEPHTGQASLDGQDARTIPPATWRSRIVYQAAESVWWETTPGAFFQGEQYDWAFSQLASLGLRPDILDSDIQHISSGERQRLTLLRSLARNPQILLLDEPTAALDPESVTRVEMLLKQYQSRGVVILMVSHAIDQAQRMATQVLYLRNGKLVDRE